MYPRARALLDFILRDLPVFGGVTPLVMSAISTNRTHSSLEVKPHPFQRGIELRRPKTTGASLTYSHGRRKDPVSDSSRCLLTSLLHTELIQL